ncbi:MAG: hypothetical protein FWD71_10105 [Oscillospiraceae bacterium]|nr:hypothetical protein [Oscillospiraceae bacterium]
MKILSGYTKKRGDYVGQAMQRYIPLPKIPAERAVLKARFAVCSVSVGD